MDHQDLSEIDSQIEALGAPNSTVNVVGGLALDEVDRLLEELAEGRDVAVPMAAATPSKALEVTEGFAEGFGTEDLEQLDDNGGLDAADLFGDIHISDAPGPLELQEEIEHADTDDGDGDQRTGLFSQEDIAAIRRSSAPPPPQEEPFEDADIPAPPSVVPPPPVSVPPPPPASVAPPARSVPPPPPVEAAASEDDLILDNGDFELMIDEVELGDLDDNDNNDDDNDNDNDNDDPTFIGSVADFEAEFGLADAADDAPAEAAPEAVPNTEVAPTGEAAEAVEDSEDPEDPEGGEKKGFFKKLFG